MVERSRGEWIPNTTEPVLRQWMEYGRCFLHKPAPFASFPQHFDHASEAAKGEGGKRQEGQRSHGCFLRFGREAGVGGLGRWATGRSHHPPGGIRTPRPGGSAPRAPPPALSL